MQAKDRCQDELSEVGATEMKAIFGRFLGEVSAATNIVDVNVAAGIALEAFGPDVRI